MAVFLFFNMLFLSVIAWEVIGASLSSWYASDEKPTEQQKMLLNLFTATLGFIIAIATFVLTNVLTKNAQRKQHTITILFETRLSDRFHTLTQQRQTHFPEYQDVDFERWKRFRGAEPANPNCDVDRRCAEEKRASANAVTSMLNYYEFLAIGITANDLDADMLKQSVRGIMCNLVDDCRFLICNIRKNNDKAYAHLVQLYASWRIDGAKDINGNDNERPIPTDV